MTNFISMLRKQCMDEKMNTEKFTQMLIDEEYLVNNQLQNCYFCDNEKFDIIQGGYDVYRYIQSRVEGIYKNHKLMEDSVEEIHYTGLLCNWLNFHGIPIFADADKFPDLALLYCKNCGRILGIKLDKWYYPYCGFFDDANTLKQKSCSQI